MHACIEGRDLWTGMTERTSLVHPLAATQRISLKILIAEIVTVATAMCFLAAKIQSTTRKTLKALTVCICM